MRVPGQATVGCPYHMGRGVLLRGRRAAPKGIANRLASDAGYRPAVQHGPDRRHSCRQLAPGADATTGGQVQVWLRSDCSGLWPDRGSGDPRPNRNPYPRPVVDWNTPPEATPPPRGSGDPRPNRNPYLRPVVDSNTPPEAAFPPRGQVAACGCANVRAPTDATEWAFTRRRRRHSSGARALYRAPCTPRQASGLYPSTSR